MKFTPNYILGHSHETRRLMTQAAILRPITERLLRSTGIGQANAKYQERGGTYEQFQGAKLRAKSQRLSTASPDP